MAPLITSHSRTERGTSAGGAGMIISRRSMISSGGGGGASIIYVVRSFWRVSTWTALYCIAEIRLTCTPVHFFADADNLVNLFFAQRFQDNDQISLKGVSINIKAMITSYTPLPQRGSLAL